MESKKAQHEMVGFALIIILVAIIGVVFLSMSHKDRNDIQNSPLAENFLESLLHHTTNCSKYSSGPPYLQINDLAKECAQDGLCTIGISACDALNSTINEILAYSFKVGEDYPLKAYSFLIETPEKTLINESQGNKTQDFRGSSENLANGLSFKINLYY